MSATCKNEVFESCGSEIKSSKKTLEAVHCMIVRRPDDKNAKSVETNNIATTARNIILLLASPLIGLVFITAMSLAAPTMLAYFAGLALHKMPVPNSY